MPGEKSLSHRTLLACGRSSFARPCQSASRPPPGGGPYYSLDGSDVLLVARDATDEICDFILSNDTFRYYGIPIVRSCGEEFGGGGSRRNNIMRSRATRGSIEASVARQAGERSHVHRRCEIHMPRHRKCRVVPSIIRIFVRTRARRFRGGHLSWPPDLQDPLCLVVGTRYSCVCALALERERSWRSGVATIMTSMRMLNNMID